MVSSPTPKNVSDPIIETKIDYNQIPGTLVDIYMQMLDSSKKSFLKVVESDYRSKVEKESRIKEYLSFLFKERHLLIRLAHETYRKHFRISYENFLKQANKKVEELEKKNQVIEGILLDSDQILIDLAKAKIKGMQYTLN
jgi:hypothetical protein